MTYSYAVVECALGAVFGADKYAQRGSLRARIKHLQLLGLVDGKPGKGKRRAYDVSQIDTWMIALEFGRRGLDPTMVVRALRSSGQDYIDETARVAREKDNIVLLLCTSRKPVVIRRYDIGNSEEMESLLGDLGRGAGGVIFGLSSMVLRLDAALKGVLNDRAAE